MEPIKDLQHFLKHSVAIKSCDEVGKICKDFFRETGITFYNYVRVYHDGSRISLTSNKSWALYVFTHHEKHQIIAETIPPNGHSRYMVWDNDENHRKDSLLTVARSDYNIDHGFTVITAYEGYIEFQYFASTRENQAINNFYVNNLDILNSFGAFFRERASKIIHAAEKEKIIFPGHKVFWLEEDNNTGKFHQNAYFKTLREYEVSRYYLSGKHRNIYLTKREAQCLTALIDGLTAKETARLLKISHRTVHIYLESVKQKLGCQRRSELVTKAHESGFRSIYVAVHALYFRDIQKPSEGLENSYSLQ